MLFCIQKGGAWYISLFGLVTVLAANEFAGLANRYKKTGTSRVLAMLASLAFFLGFAFMFCLSLRASLVFWLLFLGCITAVMVNELYARKNSPITDMAYTLFPVLDWALPMALLIVMGYSLHHIDGQTGCYSPALPLMLFLCIWANDVGAYCTGCTLGRHKLFERVSPKKTWEGSAGGAVLTLAVAGLVSHLVPSMYSMFPLPVWLGMGLVTVLFGTWGDLTESLMKREMGVKDSGNILPGHGGILDRFDSAFMAIPAVTLYFVCIIYF